MTSLLRTVLPLAALVNAADVVFNPDSNPPHDISPATFREAAALPNATNAVPFAFGNSSDHSGANQWGLRILVTGNVPVDDDRDDRDDDDDDDNDDDDVTQLTIISLIPPQGTNDNNSSACLSVFGGLSSDATREAQDDDRGSCAFLSSDCREDLESAAADRNGCDKISLPDSCSEWFSSSRQWNDGEC